ncbi:tubulin-specific chaperone D-like [Apostichopus japonicus]|uniref:tubulin-specific chaperone D-like n=1 Tax=Stichopus japonicus TaxID=307972 RepID=UPI003AB56816
METEENVEIAQKGCIRDEFLEAAEVKDLTDSLSAIYKDQIAVELAIEKFTRIVDEYQEQPHLMDPYMEEMLVRILNIARRRDHDPALSHLAFKFMYLLTKARGLKTVVRLLPHEVVDLEPVLNYIYQQDATDYETWETRYMLFLWMSIICMIPFDMARLDSNAQTATGEVREPTMLRILNIGKRYLSVCDKSRDAAAWMVAKFLTRQDVKNEQLPDFMDWSIKTMTEANLETMPGMTALSGVMMAMAQLFKHGKREDLVEYAPILLTTMINLNLFEVKNTQIRKFAIKLTQRLGLTFLKSRVAAWRYKRGSRSLAENLKANGMGDTVPKVKEEDLDEDYDVPEQVEDVIEKLLVGLRDTDTVVRWSAAKGVGRITNRLPQELADQVVESVLELFSSVERDEAWHGGCLALAELGRRGLLVPERLPEVVPVVLKALLYDEKRGACSVGSHVRDAACYVCWSFARAYDPEVIKGHVNNIATSLVIATIFDREVNCRKAASAAFQENVGRQGTFPHGIDIVTTADYFAVSSKVNTYLNISLYIAQFEEYTQAMIDHLTTIKIAHWDFVIRELTSQALHKLTVKDPEYMKSQVVTRLIPLCTGIDLNTRHGATLAVAEIVHALSLLAQSENRTIADYLDGECISALKEITSTMEIGKMFKGMTGEVLKPAACELIQKLSLSKLPCPEQDTVDHWQSILDDSIIETLRTVTDIHDKAVLALRALCNQYYQLENGQPIPAKQDEILNRYMTAAKSGQEFTRMGATMALGVLPKFFILGKVDQVIETLLGAATKTATSEKFAEARRDAFTAMSSICTTVGISRSESKEGISPSQLKEIFTALFEGMKDYTMDSRGDVGAWVREACMVSFTEIMQLVLQCDQSLLDQGSYIFLIQNLVQQAAEKIDRTRGVAGGILLKLLHQESPVVPYIPHREELMKIFPKSDIELLNWSAPSDCFPKITQLLTLPQYQYHVLLGLTVSVGGLTESLVKHSGSSLLSFLRNHNSPDELQTVTDIVLKIFRDFQKIDRVSIPMMKMADLVLSSGSFDNLLASKESSFPTSLLKTLKAEINKSADAQKLLISIDLFCSLIQFEGNIRRKCLSQLFLFLCHRYPKIRKTAANKLYEALLVYDDIFPEENSETVQELLTETNWQDSISAVRPIRNQLCDLVGIPKPIVKTKQSKAEEGDDQT